ncbi:MAG: methyltransferase domain-containing protein [Chloroflexi bacterium]|nr:methyltransferase domain-containing protein [Chloroflexota bacterium]
MNNSEFFRPDCKLPGNAREAMNVYKLAKGLAYTSSLILFIWFFLLKIVARFAARAGKSAPCPASLARIVDNPLRRRYMRPVLGWTGIQSGEQVLELGPGPGAFTIAAAKQTGPDGRLFAVDIQAQMIAQVQQRVQEAGLSNVETHVASADDLPIPDNSIDRAFLISVLPEIPDPSKALAELHRVLGPDGILSITAEFADPDYLFTRESLRLLEQNGFTLVEKHGNWWRYTMNFRPVEGSELGSSYYILRQDYLLREYDGAMRRVRPMLIQKYGNPFVKELEPAARGEFRLLIPQLPYIGGKKNPLTFNLVSTAWFLALYRALQEQGKDGDELGLLVLDLYQAWMDSFPAWYLRLRGWWAFSAITMRQWARRSELSQEQRYPGNWVFSFVPKNGHDFGVDYTECGIHKFCQEQNTKELMPYLCSVDFIMSERMGLGLERTMTLAEGSPRCDFRFKHRRPTVWPLGLQEEVKRSLSAETVSLLRHPQTREPLRYETNTTQSGCFQEWLLANESGERFPIEDGIPIFVQPDDIVGLNKKYRIFYQLSAPLYDFFVRLYGYLWGGSEALWRQEFLRELEIKEGDRVLEVSVGTGGNLRLLPETAEYFGLDLTKGMLRQCRRNLRRWHRSAALFNGNAERLPFDDTSFDVVFHVGGINFFNDQEAAIQEMIRVAKRGTKILIVDETDEGIRQYEKMPGLGLLVRSERQVAKAPVDLIPPEMMDLNVTTVSKGAFYCLTFRKPQSGTVVSVKREAIAAN